MIDFYFIMVLFCSAAWIWGFEYCFQSGEIFGWLGDSMRDHLPEWMCKPLFDCKYCMSSVHGTIFFIWFISGPWWLWIFFCVCLTGLTSMLSK